MTDREFWKKCGWKWVEDRHYVHGYQMHGGDWYDGYWLFDGDSRLELPPITLDNLFKWAVPKVNPQAICFHYTESEYVCTIRVFMKPLKGSGETEAQALKEAIEEVL